MKVQWKNSVLFLFNALKQFTRIQSSSKQCKAVKSYTDLPFLSLVIFLVYSDYIDLSK